MSEQLVWVRWQRLAEAFFRKRVADADMVQECVQESSLRAWLYVHRRGNEMTPRLLGSICYRVLCEHLRRRYRRAAIEAVSIEVHGEATLVAESRQVVPFGQLEGVALPTLLLLLDLAIEELPAAYRVVLRAKCEGLKMREIAHRHGWTVGKVRMRLFRGRRMLHRAITERIRDAEGTSHRA